jgi:WhiB family redox-sensing transcriptional regulator
MNDTDWKEGGACRQIDPDTWFAENGHQLRQARTVCEGCDVRERCLEYALENDIYHGLWGNKSPLERRRMKVSR